MVRAVGVYAIRRDPDQLHQAMDRHPNTRATLRALGLNPSPSIGSNGSRAGVTLEAEAPRSSESLDVTAVGPGDRPACGIDSDSLAIPDYESLSASQVVPRLESLTDDELESIRQYEAANRARRTILSKIAQLQAQ